MLRSRGKADPAEKVMLYQTEKISGTAIERLAARCGSQGIRLIVLMTRNALEMSQMKHPPETLFTFSNTGESMRQLLRCVTGKFRPKKSIDVDLGLPIRAAR